MQKIILKKNLKIWLNYFKNCFLSFIFNYFTFLIEELCSMTLYKPLQMFSPVGFYECVICSACGWNKIWIRFYQRFDSSWPFGWWSTQQINKSPRLKTQVSIFTRWYRFPVLIGYSLSVPVRSKIKNRPVYSIATKQVWVPFHRCELCCDNKNT